MTEDEREEKLREILELLSKEIKKILLDTLSTDDKEKTRWIIDHIIFCHMSNDIKRLFDQSE